MRRWPCEDGGKRWKYAATSHRLPGATSAGKSRKDNPLEASERAQPSTQIGVEILASKTDRINFCFLKSPSLWYFVLEALETNTSSNEQIYLISLTTRGKGIISACLVSTNLPTTSSWILLGWPKSLFRSFHNILWENLDKLFGQSTTRSFFSLVSTSCIYFR